MIDKKWENDLLKCLPDSAPLRFTQRHPWMCLDPTPVVCIWTVSSGRWISPSISRAFDEEIALTLHQMHIYHPKCKDITEL